MIHGKKMILVPHESVEQIKSETPQAPMPVGSYGKMDLEMEQILGDKNISEFDKWILYDQVLQRYMSKLGRQRKDVSLVINDDIEASDEVPILETPVKVEVVKESKFEPAFNTDNKNIKALMLYNILKKSAGVEMPEDGTIIINDKNLGSLYSLIDATMKNKITSLPKGWAEYQQFLKHINMPLSYVNNTELKKYIKSKQAARFTIPRKVATAKALRWTPYNGPNK